MNRPRAESESVEVPVASAAPLRRGRLEELAKSVNLWLVEMEPAWLHDALDAQELIRGLQGEVDGLRHQIQALETYVQHRPDCATRNGAATSFPEKYPCSCGLTRLIGGHDQPPERKEHE